MQRRDGWPTLLGLAEEQGGLITAAQARLAGLKSTGRSAAQAGVAQADSVRRAAQAELQRTQDLVARGFLSAARLDDAQRALSVAQAQREAALAQAGANADQGTDVVQAQAQIALAQAAVAAAQAGIRHAISCPTRRPSSAQPSGASTERRSLSV